MKLFACQNCGQPLFFENRFCERCGSQLGFLAAPLVLTALAPDADGTPRTLAEPPRPARFCANAAQDACNWLVEEAEEQFCRACRHNRTIPDLSIAENLALWQKLELDKHRLFYTLLRLGLGPATRAQDPASGLCFDFLVDIPSGDSPSGDGSRVMTGHDNGVITLNLGEVDDARREQIRQQMGEPYRTVLGHLRHEVGHYYWDRLVRDDPATLEACRALFGDDRQDYAAALQAHYAAGPQPGWQDRFVSHYAAAHPWEDFAETWAHYLHIVDTLETARAFGLRIDPRAAPEEQLAAKVDFDPHHAADFQRVIDTWLPLTFAMNSLARSMGEADMYPFILSPPAIEKLAFIHRLIAAARPARQSASEVPGQAPGKAPVPASGQAR